MTPAIMPRPQPDLLQAATRKAQPSKTGDEGFDALLTQAVETRNAPSPEVEQAAPVRRWDMPQDLFGSSIGTEDDNQVPEPEPEAGSGDQTSDPSFAFAPVPAVLREPNVARRDPEAPQPASEARLRSADASATAEATREPNVLASAHTDAESTNSRVASHIPAVQPVDPLPPARNEPRKSSASTNADAGPMRNVLTGRYEALAADGSKPATVSAIQAVSGWSADRGSAGGSPLKRETSDRPVAEPVPQPAIATPSQTQPTIVAQPPATPVPLALDPAAQPALVQAARSVTAAEVEPRAGNATERLTLQLKPVDLGSVTAVLSTSGGTLTVELQVESTEAFHRLGQEKDAIGKALRDLGLDVGTITVQQAVVPAPAPDRDQGSNLSGGNGSRHDSAFEGAGENSRNGGSASRETGGSDHGNSRLRAEETGRSDGSPGRYI